MSDFVKTFVFALVLSLVCAALLSLVSAHCQPRYKMNQALERKTQTLSVLRIDIPEGADTERINEIYEQRVQEKEMPGENGRAFLYRDPETGQLAGIAFPVEGKGLWGPIGGLAALNADLRTMRGVRFFEQEETPGLGAEIEKPWFYEQFVDKPVLNQQGEVAVRVAKPGAADQPWEVDGISGATITGDGVTELLQREIADFRQRFKEVRSDE